MHEACTMVLEALERVARPEVGGDPTLPELGKEVTTRLVRVPGRLAPS